MLWFIALLLEIAFETIIALRYRKIAQSDPKAALVNTTIAYTLGVLPIGIGYALITGITLPSYNNPALLWIISASVLFAISNVLIYMAYIKIEASLYTVINSVKYVIIIAIATIFIGDTLSFWQAAGAIVILLSSITLSYVLSRQKRHKPPLRYILLAFTASCFIAFAFISERLALSSLSAGTYMVLGWGLQVVVLWILSAKHFLHTKLSAKVLKQTITIGLLRGLAGVCAVYALATIQNASLASSISAGKIITIALASYLFLGETSHAKLRIATAAAVVMGVILIALH